MTVRKKKEKARSCEGKSTNAISFWVVILAAGLYRTAAAWLPISSSSSSSSSSPRTSSSPRLEPFRTSYFHATTMMRTTTRLLSSSKTVTDGTDTITATTTDIDDDTVPYVVARGDGSTGGGGAAMPSSMRARQSSSATASQREAGRHSGSTENKDNDDWPVKTTTTTTTTTETRRPKVGAPMPLGRPSWFRVPAPSQTSDSRYTEVRDSLQDLDLHTVCEEAQCPNIGECWNGGTGTIMLLGDTCTRGCMFCAVNTDSKPPPPDPFEPFKTAEAVAAWGVDYIVLTSVDRDDLVDGGAGHFARTVELLKRKKPELLVECLVSDFRGNRDSVSTLALSGLDVYAHNVETVERLQPFVRDARAGYRQSVETLQYAKRVNQNLYTKTSLMLGLGETDTEVLDTMRTLREDADVDVITFGQYLRPTERHLSVVEYVSPAKFTYFRECAEDMGFKYCASGPMVRSSYKAGEFYMEHMIRNNDRTAVAAAAATTAAEVSS